MRRTARQQRRRRYCSSAGSTSCSTVRAGSLEHHPNGEAPLNAEADPRGSVWRRWDPHIHTPGTALSNQFGGDDWNDYLTRLEESEPRVEVLGVTDYCSVSEYQKVLRFKAAGRLPDVGLIFPNVELRLPTATATNPVNIHLLISPEDPNHVEEAKRFLQTLTFQSGGEVYACNDADLIRLGKKHNATIIDDGAALRAGTNLFKVTIEDLKAAIQRSVWAQKNVIIGVAAKSTDGASGVRDDDGSLKAVRMEIERVSRVIFVSAPKQREFWIGDGALSVEQLNEQYDGVKVCLHGSDAHRLEDVARPDLNRYTWIKGDTSFEALRQACLEPRERAIVAEAPPSGALPHRVIQGISFGNADWLTASEIPLSSGLVAIIGARGSGKTALADLIAAGAGAASTDESDQTFLQRANRLVAGSSVTLTWADGHVDTVSLPPIPGREAPGVQYLSQQFVERLCSSEGVTDELLAEVERVIFEAHPYEDRLGTGGFRELLDIRASQGRNLRRHANQEIATLSEQIETERTGYSQLKTLNAERERLARMVAEDRAARSALVIIGGEARSQRLEAVNTELASRQGAVDAVRRQEQALAELEEAVNDLSARRLPGIVAELTRLHSGALLDAADWKAFDLTFAGAVVRAKIVVAKEKIADLTGAAIPKPEVPAADLAPFIADETSLSTVPLSALKAEAWRLGQLIGLDGAKQKQLTALNEKIAKNETLLSAAAANVTRAEGAQTRIAALVVKRKAYYASLFDGFALEQTQLAELYAPLESLLASESGTLGKLTFSVRREVDIESWAARGEELMDLRTGTVFRGRGELLRVATDALLSAWESGASADVANAMAVFRAQHDQHIIEQARVPRSNIPAFRQWASDVSSWLNGTDHIALTYGVKYDGVDIEQLSPGTRGIVLLLLYLALDQTDDRPLIIDQPEENLDPKSIFVELVGRFIESRRRRQIIIVTHNANLVVNTDADQVIVASSGPHRPGGLPEMSYQSGGLENSVIREEVCEILEGGKPAFEERARRLRIRLA
jgi:energy-coupling factor transporter ATP-binding protein EcfA2